MIDRPQTRVVITGIGWVTPLGHDIETVWQNLLASKSAITPTEHFDARTFPTTFSAQVKDYEPSTYLRRPEHHAGMGRNTGYALGAAAQAWQAAKLDDAVAAKQIDHDRLGVYLGAGEGVPNTDTLFPLKLETWDAEARGIDTVAWAKLGVERLDPVKEIEQEPNMPAAHLAAEFDAFGPNYNCLTACAASTQAIGEASEIIRTGGADVMIAGGAHTMIHPLGVTGFNRLTALSNRNDDYTTAARPFNATREGFVLGEGAGMVILESLEHALARNAPIFAEVVGFGSTADAFRITDIQPDGRGAIAAMQQALENAGLTTADIDYISAHGTGTKENDSIETRAIKGLFGDLAPKVPVSSIKSMMGHLIAAAGAVELITCILAIRDNKLPPTINLHDPDPECDLDYVPNVARDAEVTTCLSNSFGFGGQNDSLIVRAFAG